MQRNFEEKALKTKDATDKLPKTQNFVIKKLKNTNLLFTKQSATVFSLGDRPPSWTPCRLPERK
jgi:hypothetical protein